MGWEGTTGQVDVEEAPLLSSEGRPGPPAFCQPSGRAGEGTDSCQGALWSCVELAPLLPGHLSGAGTTRPEGHWPPLWGGKTHSWAQTPEIPLPSEEGDLAPPGWLKSLRHVAQSLWASISPSGKVQLG